MKSFVDYLRPDSAFEPEAISAMDQAFDKACSILRFENKSHFLKEALATLIVEHASKGELDPDCLCEATLEAIAGYRSPRPDLGHGRQIRMPIPKGGSQFQGVKAARNITTR
jgi:hypothetical protein